jgi:hypothetical protein
MSQIFEKDPSTVCDYSVDWTYWLGLDTISTSSWKVPAGIVCIVKENTTTHATVWLKGGSNGQEYVLTNQIVTAAGRTDERSIRIRVIQR